MISRNVRLPLRCCLDTILDFHWCHLLYLPIAVSRIVYEKIPFCFNIYFESPFNILIFLTALHWLFSKQFYADLSLSQLCLEVSWLYLFFAYKTEFFDFEVSTKRMKEVIERCSNHRVIVQSDWFLHIRFRWWRGQGKQYFKPALLKFQICSSIRLFLEQGSSPILEGTGFQAGNFSKNVECYFFNVDRQWDQSGAHLRVQMFQHFKRVVAHLSINNCSCSKLNYTGGICFSFSWWNLSKNFRPQNLQRYWVLKGLIWFTSTVLFFLAILMIFLSFQW